MKKIQLAFRIVIDSNSQIAWDRYVFEDTYSEYRIQHQAYDDAENPVKNYWELLQKNPAAKQIPFLLGATAKSYVDQLGGVIRSLPDVLGTTFFPFEDFRLDLVSSNVDDSTKHKIGITFYSPELMLIDIIDGKYLLSKNTNADSCLETFMLPFHPQVAVCRYFLKEM